jgi:hypothetical protein
MFNPSELSSIFKICWLYCSDFGNSATRTILKHVLGTAAHGCFWRCVDFLMFRLIAIFPMFWRGQVRATVYTTSRRVSFWHCQHNVPFSQSDDDAKMTGVTWWPQYSLVTCLFHILNSEPRFVSMYRFFECSKKVSDRLDHTIAPGVIIR